MWIFLILWVNAPQSEPINRRVTEILKVIPVAGDDGHFSLLQSFTRVGDSLFLIDRDSLKIAKVGLKDGQVSFFSGSGQGPGELNPIVLTLFEKEGLLHVFHASGKRLDIFRLNGQLASSERMDEPGAVIYLDARGTLTKEGKNRFSLNTHNGMVEIDAFPLKTFGFYLRTAIFLDRYFLISSKSANKDLFVFAVFDLDEGKIQGPFEVATINKKYENGTPAWIGDMLKKQGIDLPVGSSGVFSTMVNPIVAHDKYGFLICEQTGDNKPSIAVHIYDPRTKTRRLMRIKRGPLQIPRFFLPLDDERWVTYDYKEQEIVIFKMK